MAKNRITFTDDFVLRDGKVGIGTTDPKANLSVFGSLDVSGDLRIVSAGVTEGEIITQKHYRDNGGSVVYQSGDQQLFSVSNEGDLAYVINDSDGTPVLQIAESGISTLKNNFNVTNNISIGGTLGLGSSAFFENSLQLPKIDFISSGSSESTRISAKHYSDNNGSVVYQSGESNLFSIDNDSDVYYSINDSEAKSALTVSSTGITTIRDLFQNTVNFTSAGSSESENIQLNHYRNIAYQPAVGVSTDNRGAISFDSSSGITTDGVTYSPASLFALTNGAGNIFSVSGYRYFSGSTYPSIDVTQSGRVGFGTTNPQSDIEFRSNPLLTGELQVKNKIVFSNELNPQLNTLINLEPVSSGVTSGPPRGAALFTGDLEQNLDGGQLFTVVNDNYSLFKINHFVGLSSLAPGERNILTTFDVLSNGNIGFGTTNPIYGIDIQKELRIKNDILLTTQNSPTLDNTIFATAVDAGINTSSPVNGSFVLSKNKRNSGTNSSQLFTVENNNNSNFRLNIVGISQTYLPSGQVPIFPAFDISNYGEVRIFDTLTKSGDGFGPLPTGISTLAPNDADLFRIDSYAPTFIGSFPTINPAIRVNKFGYTEIYRNINQVSGITTVGIATTTPTLSVNATLSFELVNNTTLSIKVRGTDGVTRSGIVTLS
jgi:hypothetical protein